MSSWPIFRNRLLYRKRKENVSPRDSLLEQNGNSDGALVWRLDLSHGREKRLSHNLSSIALDWLQQLADPCGSRLYILFRIAEINRYA
jgi:hypothetical protein